MSPYQLQQELVVTRLQLESQSTQTLSLEAALLSRPELPPDASETVGEEVEKEWVGKLEEEVKKREEKEAWAAELVRQLDKEKKLRIKLEEERRALASFVSKFDSLGLGLSVLPSKLKPAKPTPGGASAAFAERQQSRAANVAPAITEDAESSPIRVDFSSMKAQPNQMPEEEWSFMDDISFEMESVRHKSRVKRSEKENIPLKYSFSPRLVLLILLFILV